MQGVSPILPILRESILNGAPEQKEQAAAGMGEIIRLTSAEALKPSVVSITGPLIRVLSDRFAYTLKVEVLVTLTLLMDKVRQGLRSVVSAPFAFTRKRSCSPAGRPAPQTVPPATANNFLESIE